jgi:hypothetical protein
MEHDSGPSPSTVTRNWDELLQEIRVIETGVQILTGFLLTVPFNSRFDSLDDFQRTLYLLVLTGSVATTALVVAPVAFHRVLFRRHARLWLVESANKCARAGLVLLGLTISGVLFLVFDVVVGNVAGAIAFVAALAFFGVLWAAVPLTAHRQREPGS